MRMSASRKTDMGDVLNSAPPVNSSEASGDVGTVSVVYRCELCLLIELQMPGKTEIFGKSGNVQLLWGYDRMTRKEKRETRKWA